MGPSLHQAMLAVLPLVAGYAIPKLLGVQVAVLPAFLAGLSCSVIVAMVFTAARFSRNAISTLSLMGFILTIVIAVFLANKQSAIEFADLIITGVVFWGTVLVIGPRLHRDS